jgi:hypothetical protein
MTASQLVDEEIAVRWRLMQDLSRALGGKTAREDADYEQARVETALLQDLKQKVDAQ